MENAKTLVKMCVVMDAKCRVAFGFHGFQINQKHFIFTRLPLHLRQHNAKTLKHSLFTVQSHAASCYVITLFWPAMVKENNI